MGDNSLVNWRVEPQHCKEHAHMVLVLPKKIVAKQRGVTKKKSSPFEYVVVWAPQIVKVSKYTSIIRIEDNWQLEPQHCKEHAHMVVVLHKKIYLGK